MKALVLTLLQIENLDFQNDETDLFIRSFPTTAVVVKADGDDHQDAIFKFAKSFLEPGVMDKREKTYDSIRLIGKSITQFDWEFILHTFGTQFRVKGFADVVDHISF